MVLAVHRLVALAALISAVQARIIVVHTYNEVVCHDEFNNTVPCPKPPLSKTKVIIIVVVTSAVLLTAVGLFLFKVFRRRRIQKYQQVAAPPPGVMVQGSVMVPAAPGEMGYAGLQPQMTVFTPPSYTSAPSPAPSAYIPQQAPPPPPPPPPPHAAAMHYGYSAGPI